MASFCFQCNIDLFFGPVSDFPLRTYTTIELCESCGPIYVKNGECVDPRCRDHRSPSPTSEKMYEVGRSYLRTRGGLLGPLYRIRDRLLGTAWAPGLVHDWRHRWNTWKVGGDEIWMGYDPGVIVDTFHPDNGIYDSIFSNALPPVLRKDLYGQDQTAGIATPAQIDRGAEDAELPSPEDERPV